jgi:hypothetical protein
MTSNNSLALQATIIILIVFGAFVYFFYFYSPSDYVPVDLKVAVSQGIINISVRGQDLKSVDLTLTSTSNDSLEVEIPAGIVFGSDYSDVQNMIVIHGVSAYLDPHQTRSLTLPAACASMNLEQPSSDNSFSTITSVNSQDMAKLLACDQFLNATVRVGQFCIWTITDNPYASGFTQLHAVNQDGTVNPDGSGPSTSEIQTMRQIFEAAGIETQNYLVFH